MKMISGSNGVQHDLWSYNLSLKSPTTRIHRLRYPLISKDESKREVAKQHSRKPDLFKLVFYSSLLCKLHC